MDFIKEFQAEEFQFSSNRSIKTDERMELSNSFKGYTYKYFIFINQFFLEFFEERNGYFIKIERISFTQYDIY